MPTPNHMNMTVTEAADELGRTPSNIRQHVRDLGGRKIFGRWLLDAELVRKVAQGQAPNDQCLQSSNG
jgi:predicted transcriptional regulator